LQKRVPDLKKNNKKKAKRNYAKTRGGFEE